MLKDWLIEYSQDVLNGNVMACKKHKQACERFLYDISRENTDNFPYLFSEEKAMKFIEWMSLFKHTKGKLQGQNITPHEIQIFIFSNIYGWVHRETGYRRFKKAFWLVGRKNGKSQSLACVASYEAFAFGENMSEVYIGATKSEQAKIVWNEVKAQLNGNSFLDGKFKVAYGKIEHIKSNSFITAMSKDTKSADGFNVQAGIIDEYHAHSTSDVYDVLVSGSGARSQPIMFIISTAGFNLNHPCYSVEYKYVSQILDKNNPIENEEYFVMINEIDYPADDIKDEKVWEKSNPILCSYEEGRNFLRGELKAALDVPEKMRNFMTKNMNVFVNNKPDGYIALDKWAACEDKTVSLEDFRGEPCLIGVDLSQKIDLTAVSFLFSRDEKIYVFNHAFMPEDTLEQKRKTDKVDYWLWKEQGHLTMTPGAVVDYRYLEKYIIETAEEYELDIKEICFDPWSAQYLMNSLDEKGYTVVSIRQGYQTLSEPTKDFRERVLSKKVVHNGNPVLTWCVGNAVCETDPAENIKLSKAKSSDRIDSIVSAINAHVRTMVLEHSEVNLNDHILSDDFSF